MYLFDDATQERTPQQTIYFGSTLFDICTTDEEEEEDIDIPLYKVIDAW